MLELVNQIAKQVDKLDSKIDRQSEKIGKYNEGLLRNTITLEEHVKGSIASNKRLTIVEDKIKHIDDHVSKIQKFLNLFSPTTRKLKWAIAFIGLISSGYGLYILHISN